MNSEIIVIKKLLERIIKDLNKGYMCQWCGTRSISPSGGSCPNSPCKHHQYVKAEVEESEEEN